MRISDWSSDVCSSDLLCRQHYQKSATRNHKNGRVFLILSRPVCKHHTETTMTEIEFNALAAQGYNRIPLIAETYADLDTPLARYLKLAQGGPAGGDRKSVVAGKGVSVRVALGASRTHKQKNHFLVILIIDSINN